jgi:bifunctional pyridoxal-dependent enzyme with beta-cystathionase and maltose regulon repressor activities
MASNRAMCSSTAAASHSNPDHGSAHEASGVVRLNFGTSEAVLAEAIERMASSFS